MTTTPTDPTTVVGEVRMLIDGELVETKSGKTFDNINPATEEVIGQVTDADADDMRRAIGAARRAFDETDWSTNHKFRQKCLLQLQDALVAEQELFRHELIAEVGCPIIVTYGPQLDAPLEDGLTWPAQMIDEFEWERDLPTGHAFGINSWRKVLKEPVGVVGAVIPWNYPFEVTLQKVGQGLATGNTVIVKPAPDTPWNATRLGRLVAEKTDIPPGVLQVVTSSDHLVGEELTIDPRVDIISFTGSTATGRRIIEKSAPTMKRLFLELGGKSAHIVLDDAHFEATVPSGAYVCFHAGQGSAMLTRMLVPRSRLDESVALLETAFAGIKPGDPNSMDTLQGPQISKTQRERVLSYIDKGVQEGAQLVLGGGRPTDLPKGWYVEPTLLVDEKASTFVSKEEIFGPALVLIPFDDDDDAVRIANDTEYGLSGAVTSGSEERAISVARRIRSGTMGVNGGVFYGADAPFGGYKASGYGRQNGIEGFEQYLETKTLAGPAPEGA